MEHEQTPTIGTWLREHMTAKGIRTQEELEAALERFAAEEFPRRPIRFSQGSISQWLNDKKEPSMVKLLVMEQFFGARPDPTLIIGLMRRYLADLRSRNREALPHRAA